MTLKSIHMSILRREGILIVQKSELHAASGGSGWRIEPLVPCTARTIFTSIKLLVAFIQKEKLPRALFPDSGSNNSNRDSMSPCI
jgi:hypothetical protein